MNRIELYSDEWFKKVHGAVHATDCEKFYIWKEYHIKYSYKQESSGKLLTLGHIDNRPTCVTLNTATVDGKIILFYEGTSLLCDFKMIDDFIRSKCPHLPILYDAMNFHNVLH